MFYVYIRLADKDIAEKNIKNRFFSRFSKMKIEEYDGKKILEIRDLHNRTLKRLAQYLKSNCITKVCLSNNLLKNDIFLEFVKKEHIKYFDGKWLYKHLMINITKYVCDCKKEKLEYQEISILADKIDLELFYNIKFLARQVRVVNVITNNENKFRKLEKDLYEENGIILNINNNYKKSLIKSDIILNYDFKEDEISKYILPKKACIINFENEVLDLPKSFEGICVNFFEINMPKKYFDKILFLKDFNSSILCETFLYKNTLPDNIQNQLNKENIEISFLNGKNGRIRKTEYPKLSKKIAN